MRLESLNKFLQSHPVKIVITSRIFEYKYLATKLALEGAMIQQPLSLLQIDKYLKSLGSEMVGVRKAIQTDKILLELARSPLVLSIIALTYHGLTLEGLKHGTKQQKKDRLFEAYIHRMFEQRKIKGHYTSNEMIKRLIWLAKQMQATAQTVFRIEQLQPSALPKETYKRIYLAILTLSIWVFVSVSFGFATGISLFYLTGAALSASVNGILYGLTGALSIWILESGRFQWIYRSLIGLLAAASFATTVWIFSHSLIFSIPLFLAIAIVIPLLFRRIATPVEIQESDLLSNIRIRRLDWSWRAGIRGFFRRMPVGIVFGLVGGIRCKQPIWMVQGFPGRPRFHVGNIASGRFSLWNNRLDDRTCLQTQ